MVDIPTRGIVSCLRIVYYQFDTEACPLVSEIIADACCVSFDTPICDVCAAKYGDYNAYVSLEKSRMFLDWVGIRGFAYCIFGLYFLK